MTIKQGYSAEVYKRAREIHLFLHSGQYTQSQLQEIKAFLSQNVQHAQCLRELETLHQQTRYSSLGEAAIVKHKSNSKKRYFRGVSWLFAASIGFLSVFLMFQQATVQPSIEYKTVRGEVSEFLLPDNSELILGAESHVVVKFTDGKRLVSQITGDVLYKVAKNSSRPFIVSAGEIEITVLGTVFEVLKRNRAVQIGVNEGLVAVSKDSKRAELRPANKLTVNARGEFSDISLTDPQQFAMWRQKRLSFQQASLAEIVEVINRYRRTQIKFSHPQISHRSVSASFRLDQLNQFLDALEVSHGVNWHIDTNDVIWLKI
ncbi:FecR family protein [uncultured Paraglaciecola sp.]|uniref:FecR family protein n=1 Tax=uncultured Paraglaciecola sp. TaxID=1765024 RepID=UPI00260A27A7|nr:FecR domain-containing protein [uncultured Paraglaciecola sp.]